MGAATKTPVSEVQNDAHHVPLIAQEVSAQVSPGPAALADGSVDSTTSDEIEDGQSMTWEAEELPDLIGHLLRRLSRPNTVLPTYGNGHDVLENCRKRSTP